METITANMVFLVQLIRYRIQISVIGHRAVESIVEHTYLWGIWHQLIYGTDTFQVTGIMNGSEVTEFLYSILHALVNEYTLIKLITTLHDTMAYGVYLIDALQRTNLWVEQYAEHHIHAFLMVGHVVHNYLFLSTGQCHLDESAINTDALHTTLCHY